MPSYAAGNNKQHLLRVLGEIMINNSVQSTVTTDSVTEHRGILDDGLLRRRISTHSCEQKTPYVQRQMCCERNITNSERKCADTIGTVPVLWAGHFQC